MAWGETAVWIDGTENMGLYQDLLDDAAARPARDAERKKIVRPQARNFEANGSVTHNHTDPFMLLLLVFFAGLVIPSPAQIGTWIGSKFKRK